MARPRASFEVRARMIELICEGASVSAAAAAVGVSKQSALDWWREAAPVRLKLIPGRNGGLGPVRDEPPSEDEAREDDRSARLRRMLSSEDRAVSAACVRRRADDEKISLAQIGESIDRDKTVISREIIRNSGPDGSYHGPMAHRVAQEKRRRPKGFRVRENPRLCRRIETWMDAGLSPKLIATVLRRGEYP